MGIHDKNVRWPSNKKRMGGIKMKWKIIIAIEIMIIVICLLGWGKSIVKLCQCDFQPDYKAEIIYTIGVTTPAGVVIGWMDFGE